MKGFGGTIKVPYIGNVITPWSYTILNIVGSGVLRGIWGLKTNGGYFKLTIDGVEINSQPGAATGYHFNKLVPLNIRFNSSIKVELNSLNNANYYSAFYTLD